jgi:hypothetical protein
MENDESVTFDVVRDESNQHWILTFYVESDMDDELEEDREIAD